MGVVAMSEFTRLFSEQMCKCFGKQWEKIDCLDEYAISCKLKSSFSILQSQDEEKPQFIKKCCLEGKYWMKDNCVLTCVNGENNIILKDGGRVDFCPYCGKKIEVEGIINE